MTAVRLDATARAHPVLELRRLGLERYKGYARATEMQLAPLTILVGANNAGKTALARAIQLVAGGLAPTPEYASEPLPPMSGGLRHGETFEDLVTGRASHGRLRLSATFAYGDRELSLSATVTNVVSGNGATERQISDWSLGCEDRKVALRRQGFERGSGYEIDVSERRSLLGGSTGGDCYPPRLTILRNGSRHRSPVSIPGPPACATCSARAISCRRRSR